MKTKQAGELKYFQFDSFDPRLVDHYMFTRKGGHSTGPFSALNLGGTNGDDPEAVAKNHDLIFDAINRPLSSRFDVWQVHGTTILFGDEPRPIEKKHTPADGIFTDRPEVTLLMRFADCVPLLFHDPARQVVGIVHAGWQGTMLKIGAEAVKQIGERYGSKPEDLVVGVGPSICTHCYQVGEDVCRKFHRLWGGEADAFILEKADGLYLDLWGANEFSLRQAGVKTIEQSRICTGEHLDEWYSYRKERGLTGRFAVVIALKRDENSR